MFVYVCIYISVYLFLVRGSDPADWHLLDRGICSVHWCVLRVFVGCFVETNVLVRIVLRVVVVGHKTVCIVFTCNHMQIPAGCVCLPFSCVILLTKVQLEGSVCVYMYVWVWVYVCFSE